MGPAAEERDDRGPAGRMSEKDDFRGWDLWVQNNQVGMHLINKWPTDALRWCPKNPAQGPGMASRLHHLRRLGQGRGRQGVRQPASGKT